MIGRLREIIAELTGLKEAALKEAALKECSDHGFDLAAEFRDAADHLRKAVKLEGDRLAGKPPPEGKHVEWKSDEWPPPFLDERGAIT